MRYSLLLLAFLFLWSCQKDDDIMEEPDPMEDKAYFPPINGQSWEKIDTDSLEWDTAAMEDLKTFMSETSSRAILIIKDGKIAFEHYEGNNLLGGNFDKDSDWYWASAGKTLTATLVGISQQKGLLDINNSSSNYLGEGWTSLDQMQEMNITVRHQLTMTSGLDDSGVDSDCTDPECLEYLADPGSRWSYHNAPYTRLDGVVEGASGTDFDSYFNENLRDPIGMNGFWTYLGYNHVYFSTPRSMARFGLLILNEGTWDENEIISDKEYVTEMVTTSQDINESYGYLWWLNGKNSFMLPGLQFEFQGNITQNAPSDMYSGIGKNGQVVSVIPSENMVVVRMGDNPDTSLVPVIFVDQMWEKINAILNK